MRSGARSRKTRARVLVSGSGLVRIVRSGSARRESATLSACASSVSLRSSGMRITAASTSRSSTTISATASSVRSSESDWANEREIS